MQPSNHFYKDNDFLMIVSSLVFHFWGQKFCVLENLMKTKGNEMIQNGFSCGIANII